MTINGSFDPLVNILTSAGALASLTASFVFLMKSGLFGKAWNLIKNGINIRRSKASNKKAMESLVLRRVSGKRKVRQVEGKASFWEYETSDKYRNIRKTIFHNWPEPSKKIIDKLKKVKKNLKILTIIVT